MTLTDRTRDALGGHYEVEREAGHGGMATVFRARDLRHDRIVAVKVLHPDLAAAIGADRFLREVRITARLSHPHILPLLDSGEGGGLLYYVMPFVEGETLRARLDREGPLPVGTALGIAREVADALSYAHGRGIVHRDIKPENILLESGHALIADFGIARAVNEAVPDRMTATGLAVGTPQYMSPEQAVGAADIDARSDLYSLGCVLYEMLTGTPPFSGPTAQAIVARRLSEPAPSVRVLRDTVDPTIDGVVQRALARTPADRFQTAAEMVAALVPGVPAPPAPHAPVRWRRWRVPAMASAAVLAGTLTWWLLVRSPGGGLTASVSSIAVLPFVNVGADTTQEYFADGLTDELISSLSMVEGLQVASRTSSFTFKERDVDVRAIGRQLGVQSVLEGSVRRGEGRIRVAARLVSVADGYQRWSQTYERNADDAFIVQQEIARVIADTLQGRLGRRATQPAVALGTATHPYAYDLFLRGRYFRHRRTEEGIRRAIELFTEAVDSAPDFARAHAGLAEALAVLGFYDYEPAREVFPDASQAAQRALRLDASLGSAHATLGYVALYYDWDWPQAEREFLRAIELEPAYATAHQWYANYLTAMGRFDEAERAMRQAQSLDPLALIANAALGWVQFYRGDFDRAASQLRSTLEQDSTFILAQLWYGQVLESMGRFDDAIGPLRRGVALSGGGTIFVAALARALALRGDRPEAERLLADLERARVVPAFEIAKVHLALGRRDEVMRWLERAFDLRVHSMALLRVDPQFEPLRGDPAFDDLVRRVGR